MVSSGWQKLVADGGGQLLPSARSESWQVETVTVGMVPPVQLTTDSVRNVLLHTVMVFNGGGRVDGLKLRAGVVPRTPISFVSTPGNSQKSKSCTPVSGPAVGGGISTTVFAPVAPPRTHAWV